MRMKERNESRFAFVENSMNDGRHGAEWAQSKPLREDERIASRNAHFAISACEMARENLDPEVEIIHPYCGL